MLLFLCHLDGKHYVEWGWYALGTLYSPFCINIERKSHPTFVLLFTSSFRNRGIHFHLFSFKIADARHFLSFRFDKSIDIVLKLKQWKRKNNERNDLCTSESTWRQKATFLETNTSPLTESYMLSNQRTIFLYLLISFMLL